MRDEKERLPVKGADAKSISVQVCEALGLDPNAVLSIEMNFHAEYSPSIEVRMWVSVAGVRRLNPVLKRYKLVPKEDSE